MLQFDNLLLLAEGESSPFAALLPLILIGVVFYFLIIRPQSKERAKLDDVRSNLKKNDRIVTIGGILGVVVNVNSDADEVTIRVDEGSNTKLRVMRSAISRVITDSPKGTDEKDKS